MCCILFLMYVINQLSLIIVSYRFKIKPNYKATSRLYVSKHFSLDNTLNITYTYLCISC